MAISTKYIFNGIEINNAYIRVDEISGSKVKNWKALIGVYLNDNGILNKIDSFNIVARYKEDERGYFSLYTLLKNKFQDATDC